jgi:dephospho-CoA kinase
MSSVNELLLPKFIAVTGLEASGKDSYANHLADLGYMHVAAGDVLRARARFQGYSNPIPRSVLSVIGDELKREFGDHPITKSTLARYEEKSTDFPRGLVISGLRRVGELQAYKKAGAVSIWIEASDEVRVENHFRRNRSSESRALFLARSLKEYQGQTSGGLDGVNVQAIEKLADCRVNNDGTLENLFDNADRALGDYLAKQV